MVIDFSLIKAKIKVKEASQHLVQNMNIAPLEECVCNK
jgi:hypothetical protein